ncbi:MAG: hypothetical protein JWN46_4024 [Acidimicrobiales bacterium]|nr:hypothetical protein [Acidimicrobiales bacterium]
MQVYELADELGVRSIEVVDACEQLGVGVVRAGTQLDEAAAEKVRAAHRRRLERNDAAALVLVPSSPVPVAVAETGWVPPGAAPPPPPPPWIHATQIPQPPPPAPPKARRGAPTHPLVNKALLHLVLGHVVPFVGIYFWISSVVVAGKARRQIRYSGGRYGGDTTALVVQIVFWVEVAAAVVGLIAVVVALRHLPATPTPVTAP